MKRCNCCFEQYDSVFEICPHCGYVEGDAANELYHLYPGTRLHERYIVGQTLGFGGFGITYKAWDENLKTVIAIKEYYPSGLVNRVPGARDVTIFTGNRLKEYNHGLMRFLDEARSMARFNSHKNIINVFEYFEENNTAYIVMEYLEGTTLNDFLKYNKIDVDSCIDIINKVSSALKDIHKVGIVHRDVSPDNIFLCTNNSVKLIDFGAARFSRDEEKLMTIILKPGFAPPEQYEKVNVQGPWTDIYALGATLYYMITGIKPEESTNRKIEDILVRPNEIDPNIPEYVSNTVMQAMALDKHMRFSEISDFEKAINQERRVLPIEKQIKRRKNRRVFGLTAAFLIVIISSSLFYLNWNKQKEEETLPDASISMAFSLSGNAEEDEKKEEALSSIIKEFKVSFPNVEIDVQTYAEDKYKAAVLDGGEGENTPILFESSGLNLAELENTLDLGKMVEQLDNSEYYFLDQYNTYFPGKKQFPLGFEAPVIYLNKTLSGFDEKGIENLNDLLGVESTAEVDFVTDKMEDAKNLFLEGKASAYLSTTALFFDVQSALPARYNLIRVETDDVFAEFTDLWSINQCSKNERKVAERFLRYLVSDNAQDYLYIRGHSRNLPINKYVLGVFCEVYDDFEDFFVDIESYKFEIE